MDAMPIITLKNGLKVANFSSPHEFKFVTGEVLPACSEERARGLMLDAKEIEIPNPGGWVDIDLTFELSDDVHTAIMQAWSLHREGGVNIVLVPLPVMQCIMKQSEAISYRTKQPFRVVRVADRVKKLIHSDRFCL